MLKFENLRSVLGSVPLLAALLLAGCGGTSADEAMYKGNEEATKEHMQEIIDEEQAHYAEVERTAPPVSAQSLENPGAAAEEARFRQ